MAAKARNGSHLLTDEVNHARDKVPKRGQCSSNPSIFNRASVEETSPGCNERLGGPAQTELFLGRRRELARLLAAMHERRSMLLFGPPDSGKSALVEQALTRQPAGITEKCFVLLANTSMDRLLRQHAIRLLTTEDPVVQDAYEANGARFRSTKSWVRRQTGGRLRSLIFEACERGRYWIFWENAARLGTSHFHFLREVIRMRSTPVYLLARGFGHEHLGKSEHLFWSEGLRLELGPLGTKEAKGLTKAAIAREGLDDLDLSDFRQQVIEASRNLPGAIVRMVSMASRPQYRYGNKVKTKLIHTDYLMGLAARMRI